MDNITKNIRILMLILSTIYFQSISIYAFADEYIRFVGIADQIPYSFEENGKITGIDYDFFSEISKRLGFTARIDLVPFIRGLNYMKNGTADGILQIYYKKEREDYLIYSEFPIHYSSINIFVKKGSEFIYNNIEDLYGKKVGNHSGFFVSHEFMQAAKEKKILLEEARTTEMNLMKLESGRIDCFVANPDTVLFNIKKFGFTGKMVGLPTPLVPKKEVYLGLSKNGKNVKDKHDFIKSINIVMKEIIEDGTYERILNKYLK